MVELAVAVKIVDLLTLLTEEPSPDACGDPLDAGPRRFDPAVDENGEAMPEAAHFEDTITRN